MDVHVSERTTTSLTLALDGAWFAEAGLVQLSPSRYVDGTTAVVAVVDPTLPAVGTEDPDVLSIASAVPSDVAAGGTLVIDGRGFEPGIRAVLVRDDVPVVVLPTEDVSEFIMSVVVPDTLTGGDAMGVAVLSADGSRMTTAFPITPSAGTAAFDLVGDPDPAVAQIPMVTGVFADLAWNGGAQALDIEGVGLTPGLTVRVQTSTGTTTLSTAASPAVPDDDRVSRVRVTLPAYLTTPPVFTAVVRVQGPTGTTIHSAPAAIEPVRDFSLPFGGVRDYFVMEEIGDTPGGGRLHVVDSVSAGPVARLLRPRFDLRPQLSGERLRAGDQAPVVVEHSATGPGILTVRGAALTVDRATRIDTHPPLLLSIAGHPEVPPAPVRVVPGRLGSITRDIGGVPLDDLVNDVANQYALPPHVLKSQLAAESELLRRNFRYEPLTIDFRELTGDQYARVTWAAPGARQRRLLSDPVRRYVRTDGTYLVAAQTPTQREHVFTAADAEPSPAGPALYRLPEAAPIKPGVSAEILLSNGEIESLTLVRDRPLWQKVGSSFSGRQRTNTFFGRVSPPTGYADGWPGKKPGFPGEFSVRYREREVRIYRGLGPGEQLRVRYADLGAEAQAAVGAVGDTFPWPNLEDRDVVRGQFPLAYPSAIEGAPATLTTWFARNFASSNEAQQWGNWLTGTSSELSLEFEVDATNRPVRPVDPRYDFVTPQYVAGATYGGLQIGVQRWLGTGERQASLNRVLNGSPSPAHDTPVFSVLPAARARVGIELGAAEHNVTRVFDKANGYCEGCSTDAWRRFWSDVLRPWNPSQTATEYRGAVSRIVSRAEVRFAPR